MKICSLENCNIKHHGKGYCKIHYSEFVLKPRLKKMECSVEGCQKSVSVSWTKSKLCEMHGTRLKRHGSVEGQGKRNREFLSLVEEMKKSSDPFNFHIPNRESWTHVSRIYYGESCTECGWNEGTCDVHHVIHVSKGGKNTVNNAKVLCPNCHRKVHSRKIQRFSTETIKEIKDILLGCNKSTNDITI